MGGGTIDEVTRRGMQAMVARVHLHVHHIPALEVDVTHIPFFAFLIALEYEATLFCSNEDQDLLTHNHLLSFVELLRLLRQNKCSNHSITSSCRLALKNHSAEKMDSHRRAIAINSSREYDSL